MASGVVGLPPKYGPLGALAPEGVSQRLVCRVIGQRRSMQRKDATMPQDEAALTADIIELAREYRRYDYR